MVSGLMCLDQARRTAALQPDAHPLVPAGLEAHAWLGRRAGLCSLVLWMQCSDLCHAAVANYCWQFAGIGRCLIRRRRHISTAWLVRTGPRSRQEALGDRKEDVTIESPAVGGRVSVRLLLPSHYGTDKVRRWAVVYLLHGCCGRCVSWTRPDTKPSPASVAWSRSGEHS